MRRILVVGSQPLPSAIECLRVIALWHVQNVGSVRCIVRETNRLIALGRGETNRQSGQGFLGPDMLQLDAAYALMQFPGTVLNLSPIAVASQDRPSKPDLGLTLKQPVRLQDSGAAGAVGSIQRHAGG